MSVNQYAYLVIRDDGEVEAFRLKQSAEQSIKAHGGIIVGQIPIKSKYKPKERFLNGTAASRYSLSR